MAKQNKKNNKVTFFVVLSVLVILGFAAYTFVCINDIHFDNNQDKFVIMSTTDVHGKSWDKKLETNTDEPNNLLCASTGVSQIRSQYPGRDLLLDNGDFYQGTVFSTLPLFEQFIGKTNILNPTAYCMKHMKYDAFNLGNHEFNWPIDTLSQYFFYLSDTSQLVCANIYYPGNNERVFKPYTTKTINVGGNDIKIGIIGLENIDVPRWDDIENYNNYSFNSADNPNGDISIEIEKVQQEMAAKGENCDFTIVMYHSGFFGEGSTQSSDFENYEQKLEAKLNDPISIYHNSESQGYRAVRNSKGIDMFVLGHDHQKLYSNTSYKNADGKDVLVVNGAKEDITKTVFKVENNDFGKPKISLDTSENVPFSNFVTDFHLKSILQPYAEEVECFLNQKISTFYGNWDFDKENKEQIIRQTDSIDLVNRAQIWYCKRFLDRKFGSNAALNNYVNITDTEHDKLLLDESQPTDIDLSITNGSVGTMPSGDDITFKTIFGLMPYGNQVNVVIVTGQDIKDMLEYNGSGRYKVGMNEGGFKTINVIGDKYTTPIVYGLNFTYDMRRPENDKVIIDGFSNGKEFDLEKTYCMAVCNYLIVNTSNPIMERIEDRLHLFNVSLDGRRDHYKNIIASYLTEKYNNDGGIYPTNMCNYNNETPSHWSIMY